MRGEFNVRESCSDSDTQFEIRNNLKSFVGKSIFVVRAVSICIKPLYARGYAGFFSLYLGIFFFKLGLGF